MSPARNAGVPAPVERRKLNAYVTDDAFNGWRNLADTHHVTVSGMVEALGRLMASVDEQRPPAWLRNVMRDAASIDVENRSRPRTSD